MGHRHQPLSTPPHRGSALLPEPLVTTAAGLAGRAVLALLGATGALRRRAVRHRDDGDVPGWVLVTLMTAGLVTALWVLARERLVEVFDRAITSVTG